MLWRFEHVHGHAGSHGIIFRGNTHAYLGQKFWRMDFFAEHGLELKPVMLAEIAAHSRFQPINRRTVMGRLNFFTTRGWIFAEHGPGIEARDVDRNCSSFSFSTD